MICALEIEGFTLNEFNLLVIGDECEFFSEREELAVKKCRKTAYACRELSRLIGPSHRDIMGFEFDYGLNEDEGDPSLFRQPLPLEIVDSLREKANSLPYEGFDIQLSSEDTVVITSTPTATSPEPDLQYIIHIAFLHRKLGLELMPIAKAFTAAVIDNLPQGKTINFEFLSADQSFSAILASHRDLINSRPDIAIGALRQDTRNFPQQRYECEARQTGSYTVRFSSSSTDRISSLSLECCSS